MYTVKQVPQALEVRKIVMIERRNEHRHIVTSALELGSYKILRVVDRDGEGNECRRNVDMLEGAGHRVLSSDRRDAELALSLQSSEQSRHRLAPALRIVSRFLKILLECEIYIMVISSRRDELCR